MKKKVYKFCAAIHRADWKCFCRQYENWHFCSKWEEDELHLDLLLHETHTPGDTVIEITVKKKRLKDIK